MMSVTSVPERTGMLCWRATLDMLPLSISVIPWGILCGALALQAGLSPLQAQLMSLLVYAGAAQLSATTLFGAGTPLLPIMSSTMVITSQHLLYGFTFRRDVLPLSLRWRASLAFFLTDEMFAVALKDRERSGHFDPAYALIAGFVFYLFWNLATLLGIAATFIAMTIPAMKNLPMVAATLVSGGTALLTKPLLAEIHIIVSALAGMVVGYVLHRMRR
ncbi:AzlC family ABC transporter permease [Aeromonas veronii]|uniref:AzlC family ABC transporter permease n=1 Tax=Aeromonas veronii TaxID=654 RepID=UPI003D1E84B0